MGRHLHLLTFWLFSGVAFPSQRYASGAIPFAEASTPLAYYSALPSIREQSCFVVICPVSGRMNWRQEPTKTCLTTPENSLCRRRFLSKSCRYQRDLSRSFASSFSSTALIGNSAKSHLTVGGTLILSTCVGIFFEKIATKSSGGHVITLLTAALLSNVSHAAGGKNWKIPRVPTDHFFYDWCWSKILPASLVFALLASSSANGAESNRTATSEIGNNNEVNDITIETIKGMALPFAVGSLGSILGCVASFLFIEIPAPSTVIPARYSSAILAGCLCASYIGGTVNFFATAKLSTALLGDKSISMGSLFGSMAAADLVVMAFYFALLGSATKSEWLQRVFPSRNWIGKKDISEAPKNYRPDNFADGRSNGKRKQNPMKASSVVGAIIASCIAIACVSVATRLENLVTKFPSPFNPPGTMCAFLALLGLLSDKCVSISARMVGKLFQSASGLLCHLSHAIGQISATSPFLSDLCFYLLFAAVGTTADVSSALAGGPVALAFASLALVIHAFIAFFGTWVGTQLAVWTRTAFGHNLRFRWPCTSWEEVLIASNAAIGGPSTAAAFAAGLVPKSSNLKENVIRNKYKRALVLGASIWGVFGYAIGTSIGVSVTKVLLGW